MCECWRCWLFDWNRVSECYFIKEISFSLWPSPKCVAGCKTLERWPIVLKWMMIINTGIVCVTRDIQSKFDKNDANRFYAIEKLLLAQFIASHSFSLFFSFRIKQFRSIQDIIVIILSFVSSHIFIFHFISFSFCALAPHSGCLFGSVRVFLIRSFTPFVYCFSITAK